MVRTARPAEIDAWWDRWPEANVGVVTGWVSAVVVVDIDPRHGGDETLAALEAGEQPLPPTVTSVTGGGGRHLYFAHPPHLVPSRPLGAGIDLKGEGGLVVVPPSRHATGGTYQWPAGQGPDQLVPARLPEWLDHLAVAVEGPRAAGARATIARTTNERATFAELWSDVGIELKTVEFMARCPFHDDHHPSLHIDPDGCRWFCFGCRRGGGIQALRHLVEPDEDGAHERVQARLEPENDNPFDPQAVAVIIDDSLVGHLPRYAAHLYRPVIDEAILDAGAATCRAEIRGGWERAHGDVGLFGVVLRLPRTAPDR